MSASHDVRYPRTRPGLELLRRALVALASEPLPGLGEHPVGWWLPVFTDEWGQGKASRSSGWPVTSAISSKSLSTWSTVRPASSAVAATSRSGIEGA